MRDRQDASSPSAEALTGDDLEAWAQTSEVVGHSYSKPANEAYQVAVEASVGKGSKVPDEWAARLLTSAGMQMNQHPNQDAFSYTVFDNGWILCVVCDGHGVQGEVISERVARSIPVYFSRLLAEAGPKEALSKSFVLSQAELEASHPVYQIKSGCAVAACCVHHEHHETWFAHAGDSRAVLGDLATGEVAFVTTDHKAHDPEEKARLNAAGAQIIMKRYDDGEIVSRIFVPRTGAPGLAMSRSLGDGCLKKLGVTAEPMVTEVTGLFRDCEAPVILLGTDGLWDAIDAEDALTTLRKRAQGGLNVMLGVEALCRRAQRLWIEAEGDYCDDVTAVLLSPRPSLASRKREN